jgi:uncharacterized protein YkwD
MNRALKFIRSSLLRCARLWLAAVVLLFPLAGQSATAEGYAAFARRLVAGPPPGAAVAPDIESAIFASLNSYRASKGRKALQRAPDALVLAARAHAMDLLQMAKVSHVASTGHDFESRMRVVLGKSMFLPVMAENAARDRKEGLNDADKAHALMKQWINSPRHRKSLTDRSYVAVAIGAVRRGSHVYGVQIFVGPQTQSNMFP